MAATTLEQHVALVLGATAGIGLASAEALAMGGAKVAIAGRRGELVADAAERLGGIGVVCDLTDEESLTRGVETTREELGEIDILVLNGGGPSPSTAAGLEVATARRAADLLLYGHLHLVSQCLPMMRRKRWGRIVAVGSTSVKQPIPGLATSSMFRAALASYLKLLAEEVAPDGVTVNMILPGRIATARVAEIDARTAEQSGGSIEEVRRTSERGIPAGRYGEAEEVGAAVAFFCSELARYVTGEHLRVDGGVIRAF